MTDRTVSDESVLEDTAPAGEIVARTRPASGERLRRIDRFTLLERLGEGGMGEVFAAYDERLDRKVAVKLLRSSADPSSKGRARLQREARALARLSHPNVVTVFDTGVHAGEVYIAMEFVRGVTLADWLGEAKRSWWEIARVFRDAARGLATMHELGLVHRDFKPSNVLIDQRGQPRLIDFGLVGVEHSATPEVEQAPALGIDAFTHTGAIMGTPRYMSPEQFRAERAGPASDQFSLCVALYEALYGQAPFVGDSFEARAAAVRSGAVRAPGRRIELPRELELVVLRGLESTPELRWSTMTQLIDALDAILVGYEHGEADPATRRTQHRVIFAMVALITAILGLGLTLVRRGTIAFSPLNATLTDSIVLATCAALALALRKRWLRSRRARQLVAFFFLVILTYALQDLIGLLSGRSLYHTVIGNLGCLGLYCMFMSAREGRPFAVASLWATVCLVGMLVDPPRYFAYFTAGNLGSSVLALLVLRRPPTLSLDDSTSTETA